MRSFSRWIRGFAASCAERLCLSGASVTRNREAEPRELEGMPLFGKAKPFRTGRGRAAYDRLISTDC